MLKLLMHKVKIEKQWENTFEQTYEDSDGTKWTVSELIDKSKDLPVMRIPLLHLCIDYKIKYNTVRDFVSHMKMVLDANLKHPIILDKDGVIMDGRHRVAKALLKGRSYILARRFED